MGPRLRFRFLESPLGTVKENTITWHQRVPLLVFISLKNCHPTGTPGRGREGSNESFSDESRPGKRHRKFRSVGSECFAVATKRIQMCASFSSCFLFTPSPETPGAKAGSSLSRGLLAIQTDVLS